MENFWYLFAAYTVIMSVLFAYHLRIFRAQRMVQKEMRSLKEEIEARKDSRTIGANSEGEGGGSNSSVERA